MNYLIGDETSSTSATIDSTINNAIYDILNAFPFSWNITSTTGSLSSGTFTIATDYNPKWRLFDARVVISGQNSDTIFTEIDPKLRDNYASTDYVYWITYNTATNAYTFNSTVQTGTVTYYYHFLPAALSGATDACIIVDVEALCYLAASKNWINDERNQALAQDYEQKASGRIKDMYSQDLNFGPGFTQNSIVSMNPNLMQL